MIVTQSVWQYHCNLWRSDMSKKSEMNRYLLTVARGVYVLVTCAVVIMALTMLKLGSH